MSIFNLLALSIKCNDQIEVMVEGDNDQAEAEKLKAFVMECL